jgi:hypothetical protein
MNILKILIIEKQNGVLKTGSSFNSESMALTNVISPALDVWGAGQ